MMKEKTNSVFRPPFREQPTIRWTSRRKNLKGIVPKIAQNNSLGQVGHAGSSDASGISIATTSSLRISSLGTQIHIVMTRIALFQVVGNQSCRRMGKPGGHQIPQCHPNRKASELEIKKHMTNQ